MLSHFISKFAMLTIELVVVFDSTAAFPAELPNAEDPEVLLQRIRTRMSEHLAQLPNYTCHQVVDRLIRRANSGSLDRVDTVEFEVAFVGRKELFSKTGGSRFEEESMITEAATQATPRRQQRQLARVAWHRGRGS